MKAQRNIIDAVLISVILLLLFYPHKCPVTPPLKNIITEYKIFSQNGEDGVIESIFNIIGAANKYYVEFGVESGQECNTRLLREQKGWNGLLLDGEHEDEQINLRKHFIRAETIRGLLHRYSVPTAPDLLSIDIDGNDYYAWYAICATGKENINVTVAVELELPPFRPRVVVIEYNALFPPPDDRVVEYRPEKPTRFETTQYFGASIQAYQRLGRALGYTLVYAEKNGVNLFFIRSDLSISKFEKDINKIYKKTAYNGGKGWTGPVPTGKRWIHRLK